MTTATPLSLRWERAQHIDRSTIESLGPTTQTGKNECSPHRSAGEHLGPTFWGDTDYWDTLAARITAIGCHSVVRDGPVSPDKAGIPRFRRMRELAICLSQDSRRLCRGCHPAETLELHSHRSSSP